MKQNNRQLAIAKKVKKWIQITQQVVQLPFPLYQKQILRSGASHFGKYIKLKVDR
jgi:hypothetical protein